MARGREPGTHMTLRVYRTSPSGEVLEDTGVRTVTPIENIDATSNFPSCRCPRHRRQSDALETVRER